MKTFTLLVFFILPSFIFSQTIDWIKTTGDILNDFGNYVQTDSNGNIYTSGIAQGSCNFGANTLVSNNQFNFVAKYDSNGNNLWATQYNWDTAFSSSWYVFFYNDFKVSRQGDVVMVGTLNNNSYEWGDVVKFNSAGAITFQYLIPVVSQITNVDFDANGNYFISGSYLGSQSFFGKFSPTAQLWNVNLNVSTGLSIKVTADNGFIIEGVFTGNLTVPDYYSDSIVLHATQGILGTDRFFAKYTNDGHIVWAHNYDESLQQGNMTIDPVSNSIYYLTEDESYFYMSCVDSSGNKLWTNQVCSSNGPWFTWNPQVLVHNGSLYLVGPGTDYYFPAPYNITTSAFLLNRYDLNGNLTGQITPQTTGSLKAYAGDVAFINNSMVLTGGIIDTGSWGNQSVLSRGSSDIFVAKLPESDFDAASAIQSINAAPNIKIYPNPSTGYFFVSFENPANTETQILVTDMLGKNVHTESFAGSIGNIIRTINTGNLAAGVYIVTLRMNGESRNEKIVIN
jgi:hypothetical protein